MRLAAATLAILATPWADAFTPACLNIHRWSTCDSRSYSRSSPSSLHASDVDVSVEYDAAAKLAYNEWREKFNKGPFDESKYPTFRANYEAISIANVIALKNARDSGSTDAVNAMELNEFADMTEEEFTSMQAGNGATKVEASLLENAMASSAAQSEAAMAIEAAAAALAEDEQLLVEQLGLESVEELEVAIDSIEGIAEDGGELDTTNISREVRIRAAYIEWCKKYSKTPDESRFPTFSSNFLAMEEYARENNKEMILNKYADCTEEEYIAITSGSVTTPKKAEEPSSTAAVKAAAEKKLREESVAKAAKPVEEIKAEVKPASKPAEEIKAEVKPVSLDTPKLTVNKKIDEPKAPPKAAEPVDVEKMKKLREQELEKAAVAAKAAAEAEAIATAKAIAEKEAAQIAKRRQFEAEAAEKAREQARKAEAEIEARNAALSVPKVVAPVDAEPVFNLTGLISFLKPPEQSIEQKSSALGSLKIEIPKAPVVEIKPTRIDTKQEEKLASPVAEVKEKISPEPLPRSSKPDGLQTILNAKNVKTLSESLPSALKSLLPPKSSDPEPSKKDDKSVVKATLGETAKSPAVPSVPSIELDISDPVTEAFASFFGAKASKSEPLIKKIESVTNVEAVTKPKSTISFLSKPESPPATAPLAAKAEKKEPLSIFDFKPSAGTTPTAVSTKPEPITKSAPEKKDAAFSFFNLKLSSDETPKVAANKPEPVIESVVSTEKESLFSIFSSKPAPNLKKVEPVAVPEAKKETKKSTFFSVFSSASTSSTTKIETPKTPVEKKQPDVIKKTAAVSKPSQTATESKKETSFSFFSKSKPIEKTTEPVPVPSPLSKKEPFQLFAPKIPAAVKASVPAKASVPVVKKSSSSAKVVSSSPKTPIKAESKPAPGSFLKALGSGTISLQPLKKSSASDIAASSSITDDIPIIKSWKREADGSITGKISNSKKFRNGETITTSPVRGVIKTGSVVVTSSGSKYRLM